MVLSQLRLQVNLRLAKVLHLKQLVLAATLVQHLVHFIDALLGIGMVGLLSVPT